MAIKPSVIPTWAKMNQTDPESGQNNVSTPPPEKQNLGWNFKDYPRRNWMNWLGRYTYLWIEWFNQQESQSVVTDEGGVGLFPINDALIVLYAVDPATPANFLYAMGYKGAGSAPVLNIIDSNVLTLGTGTISGDQPINGGTGLIVNGQTKVIP